jgi:hypothetical protein
LNLFLEWDDDTPFEGIFSKFGIINQPNKNENFNPLPHTRSAIYEREQLYISEDKRSSPYKMEAVFLLISPWALAGVCIAARGLHLHVTSGAGKKRHVAAIVGENGGPERTTHHPQTMRGHSDEDEQASILEKKLFRAYR